MIGFVYVNQVNTWMAGGHDFAQLFDRVAEHLKSHDAALTEEIEIAVSGWPHIHVDDLNSERFNQFRQAVQVSLIEILHNRHDSALFKAAHLQALLRHDPRSGLNLTGQSTVIINDESRWHAEEWIGELLSTLLIIFGAARHQMEWVKNLETSWNSHKQIDLRSLSDSEFQLVVKFFVTSGDQFHQSLDLNIFNQYKDTLVQALIKDARNQNPLLP